MHTYFYDIVCITPVMLVLCSGSISGYSVVFYTVMSSVDAIISQISFFVYILKRSLNFILCSLSCVLYVGQW